jgi:hypothetical protein
VPNENNVVTALERKTSSYAELVAACSATHRTVFCTAEIGARGFVHKATQRVLQRLGVWSSALHQALSNAALRGSYAIYIHRNDLQWSWSVA